MAIFLVDYENVNESGFKGVLSCSKDDMIFVFYTKNGSTITFETHKLLGESKPKIEYLNVENGTRNALDFQLSSYLGFLITNHSKEQFYIVSKDKGYEVLISFWSKYCDSKVKISLLPNLVTKSSLKQVKEDTLSPKEQLLKSKYRECTDEILKIIDSFNSKQEINNALCKKFGSNEVKAINIIIKPMLKNKTGDIKKME
jgi:hypothetical protein